LNPGRLIRLAVYRWHCLIAKSQLVTRLYVNVVAAIARHVPYSTLQGRLEWAVTGQQVPWRPLSFAPRKVLVGNKTALSLIPHLGEFDQAALFRKRLDNEVSILKWLEQHAVGRYDAVIDIGANVGYYSVFFDALARANPHGRLQNIYAFEPNLEPYRRLLKNLECNDARHVTPFTLAISDKGGFAEFYQPDGHLTNGSLSLGFAQLFASPSQRSMVGTVNAQELEFFFARHTNILVKIDAEGYEPEILSAMAPLIARYHPDMIIEVLQGIDEKVRALACLQYYSFFQFGKQGLVGHANLFANPEDRDWFFTMSDRLMSAS
jgi:FkbM family methyltransferase